MKILILNGSPRKDGSTVKLLKDICKKYEIESEITHVYDLHIAPCKSCYGCRPEGKCILTPDDATLIWDEIRQCEFRIIASPTYYGNMSGMLKLLFDRLLTAFESMPADGKTAPHPVFPGRKAIIATTCNTPEPYCKTPAQALGTLNALENVLHAGGFEIIEKIIRSVNDLQ